MVDDDEATTGGSPMTTGIDPPGDDTTTGKMDDDSSSTSGFGSTSEVDTQDDESSSGGAVLCEFATTCANAEIIGGVSGDTTTPPVTASGSEPTWAQVQVSENDSGVFAVGMAVEVSLQSMGGDWDLKAYLGAPGGSSGCGGMEKVSVTAGVDSVQFTWGESGALANNTEDGTFVAVEIFPKDDVCLPGSSWSLTVTGG